MPGGAEGRWDSGGVGPDRGGLRLDLQPPAGLCPTLGDTNVWCE